MDFEANNRHNGSIISDIRGAYPKAPNAGPARDAWLRETLTPDHLASYYAARDRLIEDNRGFVITMVTRENTTAAGSIPFDDAVQEALMALLERAWDFDPARAKFSTFATRIVQKGIQKANDAASVYEKRNTREVVLEARRLQSEYPTATWEERAERASLSHSPKAFAEWGQVASGLADRVELDAVIADDDGYSTTLGDITAVADGSDMLVTASLVDSLRQTLSDEDALLVALMVGLDGHGACPPSQVSDSARTLMPSFPTLNRQQAQARFDAAVQALREDDNLYALLTTA